MRQNTCRLIASVLIFILAVVCVGCNNGPGVTEPSTMPTESIRQTQGTTAPETSIPGTSPPETTAPETTVPVETTVPDTTVPETTVPETTAPPESTSPVTRPVETQPPVTQPAPTVSPEPVYEYGDHYIHVLNYTPAPNERRHVYWGTEGTGSFYCQEYIFDVDYKTITYEIWCSWSVVTQMAFRTSQTSSCCTDYQMTPEETYYFNRITEYKNYTCGFENHYCSSQAGHDRLMREIADGCYFCGRSECVSFYARNEQGLTQQDKYLCPEYDVYRDPWFYCQECGKPGWQTIQDTTKCCFGYIRDTNCQFCGIWVKAGACHTCKQEDIDAFQANNN